MLVRDAYAWWLGMECHFLPQDVDNMGWVDLVRFTFIADQQAEQRRHAQAQHQQQQQPWSRLASR